MNDMEAPSPLICPQCHLPVSLDDYFCPNCGKNLREKPPSTTWLTQLGLYALSFFLPPLGLWPAVKYLKSADPKAKKIGWVIVVITVIAIIISIWLFQIFLVQVQDSFNNAINTSGF
jgi:uncharacterized membrane protein YvbJ